MNEYFTPKHKWQVLTKAIIDPTELLISRGYYGLNYIPPKIYMF